MRSNINTEFEQNRNIVSAVPLMFFEDSLYYMYRGAFERNINAEGIGSDTEPDSILTYLHNSSAGFDGIRSLRESFIMRIEQLIGDGLISPIDTMLNGGRLIISSSGNDVYEEDYDFIIDLGGNDTYVNQCGVVYPYTRRFKFILDLAGDDSYVSTDSFSVSLGSVNGVTFIEDYSGNDRYYLHNFSLASGFIGFSSVRDRRGDDVYSSGFFSQGAGFYGTGELIDNGGSDTYMSSAFSQGFGFVKGIGILSDLNGNDTYRSGTFFRHKPLLKDDYLAMSQGFGMGIRPRAGGGIGILEDHSGNDIYHASVFGQGGGYWHGTGILIDRQGNDYYSSAEYAQGSGIHMASGGLFDMGGDDMYYSRFGPSQGSGHDFGVGIMLDCKGDDNYTVSGGRGIGLNNGVGIFIDIRGRDSYFSSEALHDGGVNLSRGFYGMGIFADLSEIDNFGAASDNSKTSKYYTVFVDNNDSDRAEYPDTFTIDPGTGPEELFDIASMWGVREIRPKVLKAREMFKDYEQGIFEYIMSEKMDTRDGLEIRAIISFFNNANDSMQDSLIELIDSPNRFVQSNAVYLCGKTGLNRAYPHIKKAALSSGKVSRTAVYAIGLLDSAVDMSYMADIYNAGDYRMEIEVLTALSNHHYDLLGSLNTEFENRQTAYAYIAYASGFENGIEYIKSLKDYAYEAEIGIEMYNENFR
ncbi:MAG: hypothetical protein SVK54_04925 [candidate division WOR-3 bacterium]|nr:hypothetical protein [candidate division WOR-3 bacterium]